MKHFNRVLLFFVISITIITLVGFLLPFTSVTDLQMSGYQVDDSSEIIANGALTIQAVRYNYLFRSDKVVFKTLTIFGEDYFITDEHSVKARTAGLWSQYPHTEQIQAPIGTSENPFFNMSLLLDSEQQWCRVLLYDTVSGNEFKYIVSVSGEESELLALISKYCT